ncbi:uncharacterized protein LOC104897677 [Beta vulgaris subsp. vulgaris]|uniref:uncharacterized protein LOC104897677 n=1 Tax=Beta vulgaris subsp. vulgaris TaxID=3555 RepID=UPI00053F756E|nr:uncharacterized protein LOC104897677 [Beta vulgaris subsp. vulgaris]
MAEEISRIVSQLTIDDEEDEILDLGALNPSVENKLSLVLFGRLLTERSFNVEAFKRTITSVWAPSQGLVIRVLSPNFFAFQFFHWRDMAKVIDGRPWCFDNMLILLKEADGEEQPDQVKIIHSPFWVRIKNLPFNYRSDEIVKALIGNMGEILEIEEDVLGIGRYRRVRVMMDVTKPLRRFRKLKDKRGQELHVDFAYERLPFFCFTCGIMGHSERNCHIVPEEEKQEKLGWSAELKATPRKGRLKEIEEDEKYRASRKILFTAAPRTEAPINDNTMLNTLDGKSSKPFNDAVVESFIEKVVHKVNDALVEVQVAGVKETSFNASETFIENVSHELETISVRHLSPNKALPLLFSLAAKRGTWSQCQNPRLGRDWLVELGRKMVGFI